MMSLSSDAFRAYVEQARTGRLSLWRVCLGVGLALILSPAVILLVMLVVGVVIGLGLHNRGPRPTEAQIGDIIQQFVTSPSGAAVQLAAVATGWGCIWLIVRLLHRRTIPSVLGAERGVAWDDFAKAAAAVVIVSVLDGWALSFFDPAPPRRDVEIGTWLLASLPFVALILAQTSAEELVFRGYVMQTLAARFRSPLVWAGLPTVIFALLHWDPAATGGANAIILGSITIFALGATLLVYTTGNLGASMGLHFGNNLVAMLFVSSEARYADLSLFVGEPLSARDWSLHEIAVSVLLSIVAMTVTLLLLLYPRSPLRMAVRIRPLADAGG
ncbi:CPBP family intramembrane metalloprotease [Mycobacterium sp. KBS0706]|uniref:CPBP family intramembrane glutamic endopeptidase n=1 Tax=Mycobacterium sp. KBS0706 TaxID=2578109 RepID=UPI00110FDA3D|nr:CPBP family intramembrane glutamic endopeptidase [Mycobacterium sp. KBS0706]TSD86691.1 CPBP family intramembrane metalloprotease [Mycobacterium sp. KBS0706]